MRIQTGHGTIPLITLIGIWSISALNALPGLAVSPILGKLSVIFPHSTELDIQMLSSLPSLLVIPFILLAGKLTEKMNFIRLLQAGLAIFALSGILYLLSNKMWQLIAVSAMLGVGSGMIVPLSTGLISKYFSGAYRVKQFGLSSAITNVTLVVATTVTGYLAEVNWHLPFVVYLLPIVSLVLSVYLKRSMDSEGDSSLAKKESSDGSEDEEVDTVTLHSKYGINVKHLIQVMLFYGLSTFLVLVVTFNLPFLMEEYHFTSGNSGIMISLFFLAIMAPGFFLNQIVGRLKEKTKFYSLLSIAIGLALIWVSPKEWVIAPGCILVGLGYGVIQPIIYDKTTHTAISRKVTLALAFVMMMNYLAILLCPFIIDFFQSMFHIKTQQFGFVFNLCITIAALIWAYIRRHEFLFNDQLK
ncbi:MFS transporter [Bacteroides faecichinchillae]|uniref:Cyanate permease n=1 Tax=Bacteroides faecichinchillae TaxID=871325 RepID=A0A1M5C9L5_9BACE|nr:MFS transporter [Bacteroides faecichinchillae]THG66292.1 MFS transporter [Bacteroides faecichinchillae]SHF51415.1 Cyanate permease [Bacteroides faecichinchillae]